MEELLMGLLGGGDKPGQASQNATMQTQAGLGGLMQQLGGVGGMGAAPQQQGQGNTLDLHSILSLLYKPQTEYDKYTK